MKKIKLLMATLVLALVIVAAGCGDKKADDKAKAPAGEEKIKVGFMYVGPVGDAGWTYAHEQGRLYLEKELPYVTTTKVESVPEGQDAERVLTQLAQENKIVFATSFGYMDSVIKVAEKFPNVVFLHCSGFKTAPNAGNYFGRMYQARYLSGIVAGKMTKSNKIGYVAAFSIPEVVRGINAFTLGVRSVNPRATVKVVWTNTWYDPAKEKEAAKSLLAVGCDVIAQHQDTPGPQQAAEEAGEVPVQIVGQPFARTVGPAPQAFHRGAGLPEPAVVVQHHSGQAKGLGCEGVPVHVNVVVHEGGRLSFALVLGEVVVLLASILAPGPGPGLG